MYEMEKFPNPNHNSFLARTLVSFYIHLERERERERVLIIHIKDKHSFNH